MGGQIGPHAEDQDCFQTIAHHLCDLEDVSAVWDGYRLSSGAREILHGKVPDVIGVLHRNDLNAG